MLDAVFFLYSQYIFSSLGHILFYFNALGSIYHVYYFSLRHLGSKLLNTEIYLYDKSSCRNKFINHRIIQKKIKNKYFYGKFLFYRFEIQPFKTMYYLFLFFLFLTIFFLLSLSLFYNYAINHSILRPLGCKYHVNYFILRHIGSIYINLICCRRFIYIKML